MPTEPLAYNPPADPYLDIVFQDTDIIVLNKPAGLLSVPGRAAEHKDCLQSRVQEKYPGALTIHRLDMDTSGLVVMALNAKTQKDIGRLFETRQVEKEYTALVSGIVAANEGEIDLPLICDWPNRPLQKVDHENGKAATTRWQVIERNPNAHMTRLRLIPLTGRSHQLRVHMKETGHAILGDRFYGDAANDGERLMLHARRLSFTLPGRDEPYDFTVNSPF